jgi:hypothetical protein
MKTITTVILTVLVMLQLVFYGLVNARTYWGYDVYGNLICDIEIYGFRFSYLQHNEYDYTNYKEV